MRVDDRWRDGLPVLTGNAVELREVAFEDVPSLHVLIASDPKVTAHISPPPPNIRALQGFVKWAHEQREAGKLACYAVVPRELRHAVGFFQIRKLQPDFFVAEWGFVLGSAFWGTGIFEDAAILVVDFAFDTLGIHRLEARAVTANERGNGALNKLGAAGEAVLRSGLRRGNVLLTQYLWTLRADEWAARRSAVRKRFSATDVERQIQTAIDEARRVIEAAGPSRAEKTSEPLHPFLIWDAPDDPEPH